MAIGYFSLSLSVKNLAVSRHFYARLGFTPIGGDEKEHWLILSDGNTEIGLFQEMFDKNMLTFNPGWIGDDQPVETFEDIRSIKKRLEEAGIAFSNSIDKTGAGPAEFTIDDPDGNVVLIDQHV